MSANDAPTTELAARSQTANRKTTATDVRQTASYASMRQVMGRFV